MCYLHGMALIRIYIVLKEYTFTPFNFLDLILPRMDLFICFAKKANR